MRTISKRSLLVATFLGGAAWALACSPSTGSQGNLSPDGDSGSTSENSADAGPSVPMRTGNVQLFQYTYTSGGQSVNQHQLSAWFADYVTYPSYSSCTRYDEGACVARTCVTEDAGMDAATPKPIFAGKIRITGGSIPAAGITLTPGANGYSTESGPSVLWQPGDTLKVEASGGEVPAFSATVTVPTAGALAAPVFAAGASTSNPGLIIDRSKVLQVQWSGGSDILSVTVSGPFSAAGYGFASCAFDSNTSSKGIPATLLSKVPAGIGSAGFTTQETVRLTAGDYEVSLVAQTFPSTPSGVLPTGIIRLK